MKRWWTWVSAVALVAALAGCGAARSVQRAEDALAKAQQAGAETKAPFEYQSAQTYLDLAKHENEELDSDQAEAYANESVKFAEAAARKAAGGAQ